MASFSTSEEMEWVLRKAPWHLDGDLLILANGEKEKKPCEYSFTLAEFWLELADLPPEYLSYAALEEIGSALGRVTEVDLTSSRHMAHRIRVELNVQAPLRNSIKILSTSNKLLEIPAKYEKLPAYCFFCGRMCHEKKGCGPLAQIQWSIGRLKSEQNRNRALEMISDKVDDNIRAYKLETPHQKSPKRREMGSPGKTKVVHSAVIPEKQEVVELKGNRKETVGGNQIVLFQPPGVHEQWMTEDMAGISPQHSGTAMEEDITKDQGVNQPVAVMQIDMEHMDRAVSHRKKGRPLLSSPKLWLKPSPGKWKKKARNSAARPVDALRLQFDEDQWASSSGVKSIKSHKGKASLSEMEGENYCSYAEGQAADLKELPKEK